MGTARLSASSPGETLKRHPRSRALWIGLILLLLSWSSASFGQKVRGVTVSTHRGGDEWASDAIVPTFAAIEALGANWVAIHPYGRISADGSIRFPSPSKENELLIQRPIREAHRLGLKILIKPHLAYWRSPFSWRGEIEFDSEDTWARFWRDYEAWIVALASAATEADALAVGTELDRTLVQEQRWRGLIGRLRQVYDGPLTYAANWSDYQRVPFWDALDTIGIQAYFPLTETPDPSEGMLREGDVITHFGDREITNIYDYTYALEAVKVGVSLEVVFVRDDETKQTTITPRARP